ncbi:MAG: sulfite exporter TauE/SafE family protein [Pseudomonadota bacterium]
MTHFLELLTLQEFLLCFGVVVVGSIIQVSLGMGFGMLVSPIIALVKPEIIPGAVMIMGLVVALSGAWRERRNIVEIELKLGTYGRIIGSSMALGLLLLIPNINVFLLTFGLLMLFAVLMTASGMQLSFNNTNLFGLSVIAGVMGTITAVGAPPMAIIYHDKPPAKVRPTLNAFFGIGSLVGLFSLYVSDWLHVDDLFAAIVLLPAMLLGILIAEPFKSIPQVLLSRALLLLSGISSLALVLRGLDWVG